MIFLINLIKKFQSKTSLDQALALSIMEEEKSEVPEPKGFFATLIENIITFWKTALIVVGCLAGLICICGTDLLKLFKFSEIKNTIKII